MQTVLVFFHVLGQGLYQCVIYVLPPLLSGDPLLQIGAETIKALGVQPGLGLTNGQDHSIIAIFSTALSIGIEIPHGVQLVPKELNADRAVCGWGIYIQDATADCKLTGAFYHAAAAIARGRELLDQAVQFVFLAGFQAESGPAENLGRHGPLAERFPGKDLQFGMAAGQIKKLPQALLLPCPGNNSGIVKGQFPAGQNRSGIPQERFQFFLEPLGGHVVLANEDQGAIEILAQSGNQMAAVDLADAGNSGRGVFLQRFDQSGVFRDCF